MKRKIGSIFTLLGTFLVLAALSLLLWNLWEDQQAGISVEQILPQVVDRIEAAHEEQAAPESGSPDSCHAEMKEVEIDGYGYIGYVSIPSLALELPVMSSWSYPQLKLSPCRYFGSTKTDNLVIAAHNYTRHFGNLKNLSVGDAVYFTDMDGVISAYTVAEIDILSPTAIEEMTDSGYALTLFTCTYGGQSRVTVRCNSSAGEGGAPL